jgi:hypothetical protein
VCVIDWWKSGFGALPGVSDKSLLTVPFIEHGRTICIAPFEE